MTDNITIETINGKSVTVVSEGPFAQTLKTIENAFYCGREGYFTRGGGVVVKILPALPRHPKPEHARLLHRYAAEGLMPWWKDATGNVFAFIVAPHLIHFNALKPDDIGSVEITHCVTESGERVAVAIEG